MLDELRTIELGEDEVVMRFDNTGDHVERIIHMDAAHPADVKPSLHGHSIGRWDGETLVIDTIGYEPNPSGLGMNVPSSPGKHTVERLTLTADRTRLRYEVTVEDPAYLTGPAHVDAAVGPPPRPRVLAGHGGVRSRGRAQIQGPRAEVRPQPGNRPRTDQLHLRIRTEQCRQGRHAQRPPLKRISPSIELAAPLQRKAL